MKFSFAACLAALYAMDIASAQTAMITGAFAPPIEVDNQNVLIGSVDATFGGTLPAGCNVIDISVSYQFDKVSGTCADPIGDDNFPFQGEINFSLVGPDGTIIQLFEFDSFVNDPVVAPIILDGTVTFVEGGTPEALDGFVSGTYGPDNPASPGSFGDLLYASLPAAGNWEVRAADDAGADPLCIDSFALSVTCASTGGVAGDPHIRRWNKKSFDFHGECDLVMVHSDRVQGDKPFDLHIRTTIEGAFSSITSLAFQLGDEVVEVDPDKVYYKGKDYGWGWGHFPLQGENFKIVPEGRNPRKMQKLTKITVELSDFSKLIIKRVMNYSTLSFLSVSVIAGGDEFTQSYGLLGDFFTGEALGRDGETSMTDFNQYGMEWQVQENEPKLFFVNREPQLPHATCKMPTESFPKFSLRGNKFYKKAWSACAKAGDNMADCISDVMNAGDVAMAEAF